MIRKRSPPRPTACRSRSPTSSFASSAAAPTWMKKEGGEDDEVQKGVAKGASKGSRPPQRDGCQYCDNNTTALECRRCGFRVCARCRSRPQRDQCVYCGRWGPLDEDEGSASAEPGTLRVGPAHVTLRNFLSEGHQRVFEESHHGVADIPISAVSLERIHNIHTQLIAHAALSEALRAGGRSTPPHSLHDAIRHARDAQIINSKQAGVLHSINNAANAAKHEVTWRE